ncbi:TonB-dependent receptor plug domain-containing protein [Pedobacter sp. HMF7056]|uniref:TonB-dependent receptor plug domain-containing protein n=2 Tax=Hufsiella ginkgonis TaxID=2695274 RepID=A0A7K1XY83_9SPHI|nr:TonB-dependent receptor plug domain-containing protein [Hufsiella ginkgonis]
MFVAGIAAAQTARQVTGTIKNSQGEPLSHVTIKVNGEKIIAQSDNNGVYAITIRNRNSNLTFSCTGYLAQTIEIQFSVGNVFIQDVTMQKDVRPLEEIRIQAARAGSANIMNAGSIANFPGASGNFESILKMLPGVSANNELSSQYSVRGGNFDENLVYINDIEIYRPLLVRNGQQEGLSIINPDLAGRVSFFAGGYEARYGDKLSSVLDIRYTRPDTGETRVSIGLLGISAAVKSPAKDKKSYYLLGMRSKNNQGLLRGQEVKGSYQPDFYDFQFLYQRDIHPKLAASLLAGYNYNRFVLVPASRETTFGTSERYLRLDVAYRGKESDRYDTFTGALTLLYKPSDILNIKWINAVTRANEQENFDIEGAYRLEETMTGASAGELKINRGTGSYLDHARNELSSRIYSTEIRAYQQKSTSFWEWGARYEFSHIRDQLREYSVTDSAGYILPAKLPSGDYISADNRVKADKVSMYLQSTYDLSYGLKFSAGVRSNFNTLTEELLLSPRVSLMYRLPDNNRFSFRLAAGSYNQPPYYRELRNFDGTLNLSTKAQRSLHFLTGADYVFQGLGTTLTFTSELYYKKLDRLVPYKIENLRIRYLADQLAKGYAAGADLNLSGQFVPGLESAFRLSLMKTAEDIQNDFYFVKDAAGNTTRVTPGYLKRPTDQRINFSVFFQDQLLQNPAYKVHLNLLYGSALPAGPPSAERYRDVFKIPAYRRVDIGFSKDFLDEQLSKKPRFLEKYFHSFVAYAEVFNLLNINNTVSYLWIKDVNNNLYAVPNYLTSRQLNIRLIAKIKNK